MAKIITDTELNSNDNSIENSEKVTPDIIDNISDKESAPIIGTDDSFIVSDISKTEKENIGVEEETESEKIETEEISDEQEIKTGSYDDPKNISEDIEEKTDEIITSEDATLVEEPTYSNDENTIDETQEPESEENGDEISYENEELSTEDTTPETKSDTFDEEFDIDRLKSDYKNNNYLLFGGDEYESFIDTSSTLEFLKECGFGNSGLHQARLKTSLAESLHAKITVNEEGSHYCDFCGDKLGAEYDVLNDGRERCYQCSRTVVGTVEELQKIFVEVIKNMESLFGISYYTAIDVKTLNAKKLAKKIGIRFVSSPYYDGRVLGYAQDDKGTYHICLENQSPYLCAVATMAHELTHIWQYLNWNEKIFRKKYYPILQRMYPNIDPRKIVYEGMAKWIEIQYLFLINEKDRAYLETVVTLQRDDEYGVGLSLYLDEYEFNEDTFIESQTPFDDKAHPLHNIG